jgi:hypothetical protein
VTSRPSTATGEWKSHPSHALPSQEEDAGPLRTLHILKRWGEGYRNGVKLYREVREQGYAYGASNVARLVAELRRADVIGGGSTTDRTQGGVVLPEKATVPTARQTAVLFLRRREKLTAEQGAYLDRLGALDETLADTFQLTQKFAGMTEGWKEGNSTSGSKRLTPRRPW